MKTLLLVGGTLLLLLGFLLLVASVVIFLIARSKAAKNVGPRPQPQPRPMAPPVPPGRPVAPQPQPQPAPPPPPPPPPPPRAAAPPPPAAAPAPPPFTVPSATSNTDATVVAQKLGLGSLHGISGRVEGQVFPILMDGFYIGRDRTLAQVVIEDLSVSKRHVWVGVREGAVMAIDQSSTNGTYLNTIGTRIGQARLTPGDTLIISDDVARLVYKA
ncbi:MAG: FHA domain-containing protein [Acidobacteriota bacterium]